MMTEEEAEARHEKLCAFQRDFALLVRRYMPTPSAKMTRQDDDFLAMMQDSTSCFTPYVWGEEFDNLHGMRRVVCAANRHPTSGRIILGARHWDGPMRAHKLDLDGVWSNDDAWHSCEQGFIDQHGQFMSREEAWKVAEEAGQIFRRCGGDTRNGGTLYSENLY